MTDLQSHQIALKIFEGRTVFDYYLMKEEEKKYP